MSTKRGKEALAKLAEVLNKQSDIDVYIEGHTDSKPINTAQFKDNWDLSVIRATSVVRILTKGLRCPNLCRYNLAAAANSCLLPTMRQPTAVLKTAVPKSSWLRSWISYIKC